MTGLAGTSLGNLNRALAACEARRAVIEGNLNTKLGACAYAVFPCVTDRMLVRLEGEIEGLKSRISEIRVPALRGALTKISEAGGDAFKLHDPLKELDLLVRENGPFSIEDYGVSEKASQEIADSVREFVKTKDQNINTLYVKLNTSQNMPAFKAVPKKPSGVSGLARFKQMRQKSIAVQNKTGGEAKTANIEMKVERKEKAF